MTDVASELKGRLGAGTIEPQAVSDLLDAASHEQRVQAIRSLGRSEQRALYAAVDGFRPVALADLVPKAAADFETVRHYGRNTLPVFTHFEKRFCRPHGSDPAVPDYLLGYNFQTMSALTGPGYFLAVPSKDRPEVLVDYHRVPEAAPDEWPAIRPNHRGLSRFVYGYMIDTLRRVSEHVTIGSAARKGKDLGSWFVLCREERA
jgi:hypothetical protein